MKIKQSLILTLSLSLVFFSCGTGNVKKLQQAASSISATFPCKKITVANEVKAGSQSGNSITLEMDGVEVIEKKDYSKQRVASLSAKLFVDYLQPEDLGASDKITVKIKSKGDTKEFSYMIKDLRELDKQLKVAGDYLTAVKEQKYNELLKYVDTNFVTIKEHAEMIKAYRQTDSIMGKQENMKITGFQFATIEGEMKVPVVELWAEMNTKEYYNAYHFYLNRDGKPVKLVGIAMNDEK